LEFDLPISGQAAPGARPGPRTDSSASNTAQPKFLTDVEVQRFERDNLLQALEAAHWKIKGADGVAELLGVKPTTLISRMSKWGLKKPELELA
jgi:transcriptional regulator with GAF, ATPase, and Fis domain